MTHAFTVSAVIPASPEEIYEAWLDGRRHAHMTGTTAARGSTKVGGKFTVWDGYIAGRNLALSPGRRIVQAWRTTEFAESDVDSQIEVTLVKTARGTRLTLRHSDVPDSHTTYKSGWVTHYFEPMKRYFAAQAAAEKKPRTGAGTPKKKSGGRKKA
jgi:uncharacterized protein YndB with AHSA1/START domain